MLMYLYQYICFELILEEYQMLLLKLFECIMIFLNLINKIIIIIITGVTSWEHYKTAEWFVNISKSRQSLQDVSDFSRLAFTAIIFRASMDPEIDAQWKKIQEKTFTRWVNEQLKVQKVAVKKLSEDFADGVLLIVLLEVLSQKSVGKYNKKPRVLAQKMENVEKVLNFIGSEGIKLVNIGMAKTSIIVIPFAVCTGSGDIIEGNLKLILGLVWTLILHYQISMGFNIDDDDDSANKKSGKQALLEYIQVTYFFLIRRYRCQKLVVRSN